MNIYFFTITKSKPFFILSNFFSWLNNFWLKRLIFLWSFLWFKSLRFIKTKTLSILKFIIFRNMITTRTNYNFIIFLIFFKFSKRISNFIFFTFNIIVSRTRIIFNVLFLNLISSNFSKSIMILFFQFCI